MFGDRRRAASVAHSVREMLAQRLYGLCCGWEDVSDHKVLRRDLALQTAAGRAGELASAPTLSRLETSASSEHMAALNGVLIDQFIASHAKAPKELVLDIDATHVPLHGAQEKSHFHRCYDNYCYLPLYVFADQVCRPAALRRFDRWDVHYIIGLQKNPALLERVALAELALAEQYQQAGVKQRMVGEFSYGARTWERERRVIARLEQDARGANPRFVVTSLQGDAQALYEELYCARGEAENRIKEAQIDLFGRRASCHKFAANQLRLLLAALAYTLMINLRRLALKDTELERACTQTIRTKLLKIGAAVVRNTRRVRLLLASSHPLKHVFLTAAQALAP